MKVIKKQRLQSEKDKTSTMFEKDVLLGIKSPFLVQLHYSFQTPDKLYFVIDYLNGGELFFHLQKCFTFNEK